MNILPNGVFVIKYKHLTNSSEHIITAGNLEDAQLIWDTFAYCRNVYAMVSLRPRVDPKN